jgi:hypothetical protein
MSDYLKRVRYAVGQHDLICEVLGVGNSPDDPGKTALEAVMDLRAEAAFYPDLVAEIDELRKQLDEARISCDHISTDGELHWPKAGKQ